MRPLSELDACAHRGTLAEIARVVHYAHTAFREPLEQLGRRVVAPVVDNDQLDWARIVDRQDPFYSGWNGRTLVVYGHDDRERSHQIFLRRGPGQLRGETRRGRGNR